MQLEPKIKKKNLHDRDLIDALNIAYSFLAQFPHSNAKSPDGVNTFSKFKQTQNTIFTKGTDITWICIIFLNISANW